MAKSNLRIFIVSLSVVIVLVILAIFSAGFSRFSSPALAQQNQSNVPVPKPSNKPKRVNQKDEQEFEARFPTTDYDAAEPTNLEEKATRKNKNKRYDGKNIVMRNPYDSGSGTMVHSELFFVLPALPATQSNVILTADVLKSESHLSNDKTGVYSEFNVQIDVVLKGTVPTLSQTNLISVTRQGGVVRYPSGHKELYGVAGQNMPTLGKRYLFFLTAIEGTYEIVTGYEIGPKGVEALDSLPQFQAFNGTDSVIFLNKVRDAMANNN